jgi:Uncharacterized protein conserved in bacteria (DUF2066)
MIRVCVFLLSALAAVGAAWAQTPPGAGAAPTPPDVASPYSATVPVAGTSDAQRNDAIAAALKVVLQQASPGFATGADTLSNASGYVRDYHYRRAASGGGLELQVDFDPGAIQSLVAQSGTSGSSSVAGTTPASAASAGVATGGSTPTATGGAGTIWVDGIHNSHAFASLLSMLRGDPQLHDVEPVAAQNDGVLLQLGYSAPLTTVLAALETPNGHLAQAAEAHPGADASLHWTP